jgi:hypothetical protein
LSISDFHLVKSERQSGVRIEEDLILVIAGAIVVGNDFVIQDDRVSAMIEALGTVNRQTGAIEREASGCILVAELMVISAKRTIKITHRALTRMKCLVVVFDILGVAMTLVVISPKPLIGDEWATVVN